MAYIQAENLQNVQKMHFSEKALRDNGLKEYLSKKESSLQYGHNVSSRNTSSLTSVLWNTYMTGLTLFRPVQQWQQE